MKKPMIVDEGGEGKDPLDPCSNCVMGCGLSDLGGLAAWENGLESPPLTSKPFVVPERVIVPH